ncbi:hypothetical protein AWC18_20555 [Mycolicibacter nonchromogenicus]|uniref:Uncharacterized protein n=1 Tax=Mycolicibacter nonchromogenicus TaxID=1782 RepID=A0A1X1YUR3_MYCNO|nr:hypothetical protein [Mycolicibacter nonchromogenicus]ORW14800.1 hypothetical protein AWC18_20555 [Mycolicibacter nonchromogenicus]
MNRSPDDPNNDPTQMAGYDYGGNGNYGEPAYSEYREATGQQPQWTEPPPPTPWYLRPAALVGLGVLTALLIALLVWGMVRLVHKEPTPTAPATTTVTSSVSTPAEEPAEEPAAPGPPQAPSDTATAENPPPPTESEPPPSTSEAPSTTTTTEPPTTSAPPTTTEEPTTTAPSTTAAPETPTTTRRPPEIVIPLPGL